MEVLQGSYLTEYNLSFTSTIIVISNYQLEFFGVVHRHSFINSSIMYKSFIRIVNGST